MEKTGITRRIDELGRIVIPKEIRRNLKIKSSDELEIRIIDNNILLSKYDGLSTDKVIKNLLHTLYKETRKNILFTSKEKIIESDGSSKILNKLSNDMLLLIQKRENFYGLKELFDQEQYYCFLLPIIINGDLVGSIIMYDLNIINEKEKEKMLFCQKFLNYYLE